MGLRSSLSLCSLIAFKTKTNNFFLNERFHKKKIYWLMIISNRKVDARNFYINQVILSFQWDSEFIELLDLKASFIHLSEARTYGWINAVIRRG